MDEKQLLFASQNENKVKEVRALLQGKYEVVSLNDIQFKGELAEPFDTFRENAKIKAKQGYELFGHPCFSEDAGLVAEALHGRPGVKSARYAGEHKNPTDNVKKVLGEMQGIDHRSAYFIAVIAYYDGTEYQLFEGRVYGTLEHESRGTHGFGYDPILKPLGYDQTFGELDDSIKAKMSHRAKAMGLFVEWMYGIPI